MSRITTQELNDIKETILNLLDKAKQGIVEDY